MFPGAFLTLIAFAVLLWPHVFILPKFIKESDRELTRRATKIFPLLDILWIIISMVGFGLILRYADGSSSSIFATLALFVVSITLPASLFSGITGWYPARTRVGYDYYTERAYEAGRGGQGGLELKTVGWLQAICLCGVALAAAWLAI